MTTFMLRLVHNNDLGVERITHRFPEPGHSFLPNDRDFGLIETAKRLNRPIYSMEQYQDVILDSRSNPSKFKVERMSTNDFYDFGVESTNFKNLVKPIDSEGVKFTWLKIKEFVYKRGSFGFYFRYDLNEELRYCNLGNAGRRSRRPKNPIFNDPIQAYDPTVGIPLKAAKWKDIQELLQFIPPVNHNFFKSLPKCGDCDEDGEEYHPDDWEEMDDN